MLGSKPIPKSQCLSAAKHRLQLYSDFLFRLSVSCFWVNLRMLGFGGMGNYLVHHNLFPRKRMAWWKFPTHVMRVGLMFNAESDLRTSVNLHVDVRLRILQGPLLHMAGTPWAANTHMFTLLTCSLQNCDSQLSSAMHREVVNQTKQILSQKKVAQEAPSSFICWKKLKSQGIPTNLPATTAETKLLTLDVDKGVHLKSKNLRSQD